MAIFQMCVPMKPIVLSDVLAVGEFPSPDQIAILAKAGFKSILNNQPDGEVARFEPDADIAVIARRHGLAHAFAPLSSRTPPADEIASFAAALASLPPPIYAFCYSGARSAATCALLMTATTGVGTLMTQFADAGFDLEGLRPWLDEARARHGSSAAVDAPAAGSRATEAAEPALAAAVAPVVVADAAGALSPAKDLPRIIVIQPRAASFSGFAI